MTERLGNGRIHKMEIIKQVIDIILIIIVVALYGVVGYAVISLLVIGVKVIWRKYSANKKQG